MKFGKIVSLLMTAVFMLVALVISTMEPEQQSKTEVNIPIVALAELGGRQERIPCWEDENGEYVLFLPSGADLSRVILSFGKDTQVTLQGKILEEGASCSGFRLDTPYEVSCTTAGITTERTLTFLQSAQLPSLYVDVLSGSMDIIHETKGNQESGSLRLYSPEGTLTYSGQMESLKGRGNSSWKKEKKPYSLTLSREADLLGMGSAENWILLANDMDPSHLRNKAVYDLAGETDMAFAPESRWVDLYLNGEYAGVYLLSERNEIHPQRLDLPLSGSFLMSRESRWRLVSQNYRYIETDSGAALRIHDSGLTEEDLYEIWQPAENAIFAEDGIDPITGKSWLELIDLDSWVMDYLTGEIFGNVDAGTISTYFYRDGRDPDGKIYAGPVWDYDLSMGSEGAWQLENVKAFFSDKPHIWSLEDTTWYYWLNRKPEFAARVRELYKEVYRPLVLELLETGLDDYAAQLQQAAALDQRRWETKSARDETEFIRQYMTQRLSFLDSVWIEDVQYCRVLVLWDPDCSAFSHAVLPGETIPTLPGYYESWEILGWHNAMTEEPFDEKQPIYEDTIVYLKRVPQPEDDISSIQYAPMLVILGTLVILIPLDWKRRADEKRKKSIAKQKIV